MRKSILEPEAATAPRPAGAWLDLELLAAIEVTSEDSSFPIEQAIVPGDSSGWRASTTGPQTIRLTFDRPQTLHRIYLHIVGHDSERSQEFALYSGPEKDHLSELRRQQFTFSPHGATEEIEDFELDVTATVLELRIDPDRSNDPRLSHCFATLQSLKLA